MIQEKIGYIAGQAETGHFAFVSDLETYPPKHEYLLVKGVKERKGDGFINGQTGSHGNHLGQVSTGDERRVLLSQSVKGLNFVPQGVVKPNRLHQIVLRDLFAREFL